MSQRRVSPCRSRRSGLATAIGVCLVAICSTSAYAADDPVFPSAAEVAAAKNAVGGASAQVAAIDAELAAARQHLSVAEQQAAMAGEAANAALLHLQRCVQESNAARAAADAARERAAQATLTLSRYAAEIFQGGAGISQLDLVLGGDPRDTLDRAAGLDAVGDERARVMREADAARQLSSMADRAAQEATDRQSAAAATAQTAAEAARSQADAAAGQAAAVNQRQEQAVGQLAALRNTSAQLERDRQAGLAAAEQARIEAENRRRAEAAAAEAARVAAEQERARQAAAAAAAEAARRADAAASRPAPPKPPTPTPTPPPNVPPPSGGVSSVIAFARAQLGEPYAWGAAGPDSWDCSGLTMMAWAKAGVSLSHYTGSQWNETARVPLAQLQPGDLVFYGSSGPSSYHVGLYIGAGQMIHAPRTGEVVKVSSIYYMGDLLPYGGRP